MKRIYAALLAIVLLMTILPVIAEGTEEDTTEATETKLIVGNTTPMRGEFFTELWGNATSDCDVRDLLHGYNLVYWDGENGMFAADPNVVAYLTITANDAGDKTYTFGLLNDLFYSDGTRITAWDYAFSYLFSISPVLSEIGAIPLRREQFLGYEAYMENGGALAGVRVTSDETISITLDHNYLPFFYEMGLLSCNPYPISVIAPGVVVRDDGQGVYLSNVDTTITEPLFNAELLRETVMNEETGYLSHPSVVSGPYTLTAFDGVTAEFEINEYYKGNAKGLKPIIPYLTYTLAENDTMIEKLADGEFDLLNKVMRQDRITAGIELINEYDLSMANYPRVGLSYISFCGEKPTVSSMAVRQAIAYCFDRDAAVEDYVGAFGQRVDGYYGIGQWMYQVVMGTMAPPVAAPEDPNNAEAMRAYELQVAEFDNLNLDGLNEYSVNIEEARTLLEQSGWKLNDDGLRERDGVVLDLKLIYPEGNNIPESLQVNLVENLEQVGIRLTMEAMPMAELLREWYKQDNREADMFYLASNFYLIFDPSVHFIEKTSEEYGLIHDWAYTNIPDDQLYSWAVAMRRTEPGDALSYIKRWIGFQERFNELLPIIPVYSNIYFDFYTNSLQDYNIAENSTWGQAIVGAWLGEAEAEAEQGEEAEFVD